MPGGANDISKEVTDDLTKLTFRALPCTIIDDLPEEVLVAISELLSPGTSDAPITNVKSLQDMSSVTFVSKKIRRIAEPILYKTVPIAVGKCRRKLRVAVESTIGHPITRATIKVPTTQTGGLQTSRDTRIRSV